MTSNHEMNIYAAEQGDMGDEVDLTELIAAAQRLNRYNDAPLVDPEPWCDEYDSSQQYGNDLAMLADYAALLLCGKLPLPVEDD